MTDNAELRSRLLAAVVALLSIPLGLGAKRIPVAWVADHLAGSIYVIFWCFFWFTLFPRARRTTVIGTVVIATCLIEFLQLSDASWLEAIRELRVGRLILGTVFSWSDFPFYAVGGLTAWWIAARMTQSSLRRE